MYDVLYKKNFGCFILVIDVFDYNFLGKKRVL